MDVLYVIGNGSKHGNLELRMSLRSISKYADNLRNVVVVGSPPDWLSPEVKTLAIRDKYGCKHSNILACIEAAIDAGLVHGDFLYSSDDHFYIRKCDFDNYPYYHKADALRDRVLPGDKFYAYHTSIVETRKLLEKHHLPIKNYSQHCNTHMHTEVFKDIRDIVHESYKLSHGAEPTCLIMNAWMARPNHPTAVHRNDLKIRVAASMKELWRQIGNSECFSIGDSLFRNGSLRQLFATEYGVKCRFEM